MKQYMSYVLWWMHTDTHRPRTHNDKSVKTPQDTLAAHSSFSLLFRSHVVDNQNHKFSIEFSTSGKTAFVSNRNSIMRFYHFSRRAHMDVDQKEVDGGAAATMAVRSLTRRSESSTLMLCIQLEVIISLLSINTELCV